MKLRVRPQRALSNRDDKSPKHDYQARRLNIQNGDDNQYRKDIGYFNQKLKQKGPFKHIKHKRTEAY